MDTDAEGSVSLSRFLQLALFAAAVYACVDVFACESIYIASASMEPKLPVGTYAFLDKLTLRLRPLRRGEIIVFRSPLSPKEDLTKRVIAIAGDTVELRDKTVFLNGTEAVEGYARHTRSSEKLVGDSLGPLTVPPGSLFVLGDNRDESNDSSVWKDPKTGSPAPFIHAADVRGVVRGFF